MARSAEYLAWQNMQQRCGNRNFPQYANYGGRGITVFKGWVGPGGFSRFHQEVGDRPSSLYSLDRKDNDQGYVPGNVRWSTATVQNRNTTKNVVITIDGRSQTVSAWALESGIGQSTIRMRIKAGWPPDTAVCTQLRHKGRNGT